MPTATAGLLVSLLSRLAVLADAATVATPTATDRKPEPSPHLLNVLRS